MAALNPCISPHVRPSGHGEQASTKPSFPDSSGWNEVTSRCPGFPTDRGQDQAGVPVGEAGLGAGARPPLKLVLAPSETGLVCFQVLFFLKLVHSVGI